MQEIWKDIEGYEGLYQVSNLGRVRSYHKLNGRGLEENPHVLTPKVDKDGYFEFNLRKDKTSKYLRCHRLVAQTFIPNPENKSQINHKNGVKTDNEVENLEWVNCVENIHHAFVTGLRVKTPLNNPKSIKVAQYTLDGKLIKTYPSMREVERQTNFKHTCISRATKSKTHYSHGFIWKAV